MVKKAQRHEFTMTAGDGRVTVSVTRSAEKFAIKENCSKLILRAQ
jgi:hypothetical protein